MIGNMQSIVVLIELIETLYSGYFLYILRQ
jgi:hypothetical protein